MPDNPLITLTTDFGIEDPFVGSMKGVILKINPQAEIIDLTHGIRPYDIREAAYAIGMNFRYFPNDTIHIVVVDPGVGSNRRPLIVNTDHHYFIGPDNGVFSYIYGIRHETLDVVHITSDHYFLSSHSPTFQGRDIFAPVAAWFSRGVKMDKFGGAIEDYVRIPIPFPAATTEGALQGEIILIDRFGNAITNITRADISKFSGDKPQGVLKILFKEKEVPLKDFYSQAGDDNLYSLINSSDYLEFFIRSGSASSGHKISIGDKVRILL